MDPFSSISVSLLYLVLLILGLVYAVFLLVTGHFFGGDMDVGHHEFDLGHHGFDMGHHGGGVGGHGADATTDQHGISPVSPLTIATFITAFGAIGLAAKNLFEVSDRGSLLWAGLGGFVFSLLVYIGFTYLFIKPQGSSEVHVAELAGHSAQVITPIPAEGLGEVALVSQGGRVTYSARSLKGVSIAQGTTVRVVQVTGGIAVVELEF